MEDIGATKEMKSLFEGMDFVLSSPLDMVDVGIAPAEPVSTKSFLAVSQGSSECSSHQGGSGNDLTYYPAVAAPSSPSHLPQSASLESNSVHLPQSASLESNSVRAAGDPLDESLFSGLSFSSIDSINLIRETIETSDTTSQKDTESSKILRFTQGHIVSESIKPEVTNFKKVAAASQSNDSARQSIVGSAESPASISTKPLMRRKKRGLKIGYGRDDDSEESSFNRIAQKVIDKDFGISSMVSDFDSEKRIQVLQLMETDRWKDISVCRVVGQMSQVVETLVENSLDSVPLTEDVEEEGTLSQSSEKVFSGEMEEIRSTKEMDGMETKVELQEKTNEVLKEEAQQTEEDSIDKETEFEVNGSGTAEEMASSEEQVVDGTKSETVLQEAPNLKLSATNLSIQMADGLTLLAKIGGLTFEEKFLAIKDFIAEKIMVANEKAESATCTKKSAVQKRRQASEKVTAASLKRKELEIELELACEKEDFEMAETLNEEIAEAEGDMEVAEGSLREAEEIFDSAVVKSQETIDLQINIEEEGARLLEELKQEAEAVAERVKKKADELAADENERLITLEEENELKKRKTVLELRVIDEANSDLEKVIAESTKSEIAEKDILIDKRAFLEAELKELMARVRAKEADIAEHDKQITEMDDKITNVILRFEKQRTDFDIEAKAMSSLLKKLNGESEQIQSEKLKLEGTLLKADEERINLQKVAKAAMDEWAARHEALNMKKIAALAASQAREKKRELVVRETQASKEAQVLRQEGIGARSHLQELASTRVKLQQDISAVQQRISHAEKRAPELESEKRIAATARNFKEAARLAAEAKMISAEKDALILELDGLVLHMQKLDQEVESKVSVLADTEGAITAKEKEAAKARCERLRLIARGAREERDSAIGLEDFEEAESLDVEAESADSEADELRKIHELQGEQYEKMTIILSGSLNETKEENLTSDDKS